MTYEHFNILLEDEDLLPDYSTGGKLFKYEEFYCELSKEFKDRITKFFEWYIKQKVVYGFGISGKPNGYVGDIEHKLKGYKITEEKISFFQQKIDEENIALAKLGHSFAHYWNTVDISEDTVTFLKDQYLKEITVELIKEIWLDYLNNYQLEMLIIQTKFRYRKIDIEDVVCKYEKNIYSEEWVVKKFKDNFLNSPNLQVQNIISVFAIEQKIKYLQKKIDQARSQRTKVITDSRLNEMETKVKALKIISINSLPPGAIATFCLIKKMNAGRPAEASDALITLGIKNKQYNFIRSTGYFYKKFQQHPLPMQEHDKSKKKHTNAWTIRIEYLLDLT